MAHAAVRSALLNAMVASTLPGASSDAALEPPRITLSPSELMRKVADYASYRPNTTTATPANETLHKAAEMGWMLLPLLVATALLLSVYAAVHAARKYLRPLPR